uniref:Zinc transporter 2 n=1 Tax=Ascaris lumbricoides TaxID=6252 RepID=A0A9J2PSY9_ASCLU
MTVPKALGNFNPPTITTNDKPQKILPRDRSESMQSVMTSLNSIQSLKDDLPLYYCDKDLFNRAPNTTSRAERSLYLATVLTIFFIIAEVFGGYLANSLAIMTDAGHMLSDLASFVISIIAIKISHMKPTKRLSYGFHRAEVLGALTSVLLIWILTGVLVYLAIVRIVHNDFEVDADLMLITAGTGVIFNIIMGAVLHLGKTEHSHFQQSFTNDVEQGVKDSTTSLPPIHDGNNNQSVHKHKGVKDSTTSLPPIHDGNNNQSVHKHKANINVRAAFVHVLGDLVQSIGVLMAAVIVKSTHWRLADPICTFFFSVLVLITTATVLRDAVLVLMEAAPRHVDIDTLHADLCSIEGVRDVHSLRVWSLTMDKTAISVHLDTEKDCDSNHVVHEANERLRIRHGIKYITVQVQCVCSRSVSQYTLLSLPASNVDKPAADNVNEQTGL